MRDSVSPFSSVPLAILAVVVVCYVVHWIIRSAVRFGVREGLRDHEMWMREQNQD